MAAKLTVGEAAPEFRLKADDGREVKLRDYRGRWLVLYFFPKALTPG
jgi:peroxiredoxin Q/BCP